MVLVTYPSHNTPVGALVLFTKDDNTPEDRSFKSIRDGRDVLDGRSTSVKNRHITGVIK
jgi:hypothetical protein